MHRPRHRPRRSARLYFSLLSVLALVAFACVPALAQAECTDSSCAQYEVEIPTAEGKTKKKSDKSGSEKEQSAETSTSNGGNTGGETPSGEEGSEEPEEEKSGVAAGKDNGGGPSDKNGSPAGGGPNESKGSVGQNEGLPVPATESGEQASNSSGGGSSPLVPILIAVAVLAAISIGAVIYRQRRQGSGGSGSPVSPNA